MDSKSGLVPYMFGTRYLIMSLCECMMFMSCASQVWPYFVYGAVTVDTTEQNGPVLASSAIGLGIGIIMPPIVVRPPIKKLLSENFWDVRAVIRMVMMRCAASAAGMASSVSASYLPSHACPLLLQNNWRR